MTDNELVKALRWMSKVRICETKMVNCHECEFHGFCTDPDSDESIANQIVFHEQAATRISQLARENAALKEAQRWRTMDEKPPTFGIRYFVRIAGVGTDIAFYSESGNWCTFDEYLNDDVECWQPLPQPPKG